MTCKGKRTPTCVERECVRKENERRVKEMKGKKEEKKVKSGKDKTEGEKIKRWRIGLKALKEIQKF